MGCARSERGAIKHSREAVVVRKLRAAVDLFYCIRPRYDLADDSHSARQRQFRLGHRVSGPEAVRSRLNGPDDGGIAGAATESVLERLSDLGLRWIGRTLQQCRGSHDLARDTEAALHRAKLHKRLLQRMEMAIL